MDFKLYDNMKQLIIAFILTIVMVNVQAQNYDESKVPEYTLPDVLKTTTNIEVSRKMTWKKARRPEILKLFEDNIYGQMPKSYNNIKYSVINENATAMNGKARLKEILIEVFNNNKSVKINLVLFVPNNARKPAPAFLLINIGSSRGLESMDPTRVTKNDFWPAEMLIDSGYAVATFDGNDLAPDNKTTFANGALQLYPEQITADNGMRAVGAWGWGASRVMDYFEKDVDIDAKKVALVGHSRGGKASLWAAAQDQRFALCISNCSGNSGAALARRQFGERIRIINTFFPHWFTPNYKKYNDHEDLLPVDQHMLIALIAPRPVYVTNASKDLWADPKGTFLSLKNAERVFALYGIRSNLPANPPGINESIIQSPLAYHNREGEHDLTVYDWNNFIKFANYHYK